MSFCTLPQRLFRLSTVSDVVEDVKPPKVAIFHVANLCRKPPGGPPIDKSHLILDDSAILFTPQRLAGLNERWDILDQRKTVGNDVAVFQFPAAQLLLQPLNAPNFTKKTVEVENGVGPVVDYKEPTAPAATEWLWVSWSSARPVTHLK